MIKEDMTQEWYDSLTDCELEIVEFIDHAHDFAVLGDAMPFIEEMAAVFDYNVVEVEVHTIDDIRGQRVVCHDRHCFDYEPFWENTIKESEKKSLLIFHIDEADDRLVNALKPIVERHDENYFVCLICADKTRDLASTTTYQLVKPIVVWE